MFNHSGHICDCASSSIWMTELFDGDISAAKSEAARAHLKSCQNCQRVWRDWSRTRAMLQAVPSPAIPPVLSEQVLLSCRLLASQDAAAQSALENEINREELARYINAPDAEYSASFAAPLAAFFEEKAVPAQMKSQILQQVFEMSAHAALQSQAKRERVNSMQAVFALPVWQNLSDSATNLARDWSLPRAGRWGFALAVPALAAWVLMAVPPSNTALAPIAVLPGSAPSTLQHAASSSSAHSSFNASFFRNLLPDIAMRMAASPIAPKAKTTLAVKPAEAKYSTEEIAEETAIADAANESLMEERPLASTVALPSISSSPFAPRFANYSPPQATVNSAITRKNLAVPPTPIVRKMNPRKINSRKKPMLDMARSRRISQPSVSFSDNARLIAASMLKRLPSNDERRVSTMQNVEERNSAPALFASTGFDEAFESVGRLNDDRPEEVGKAFDDYRASLTEQNSGDGFTDEDLNEQL